MNGFGLLLLHCHLNLWVSSVLGSHCICSEVGFFFMCNSEVHQLWGDNCACHPFYLTTEVITFCLHGWCMLGMFLLLAFTRLGHEFQDLMSLCNGMHACLDEYVYWRCMSVSFVSVQWNEYLCRWSCSLLAEHAKLLGFFLWILSIKFLHFFYLLLWMLWAEQISRQS